MKSLNKTDLSSFMERFDNFSGGELVSLEICSSNVFKITLTVQDKNRGFDWVTLNFECSGVTDAKLLDDSAIKAVDMSQGGTISFSEEGIKIGFGSNEYLASPLHICTKVLKYEETRFCL